MSGKITRTNAITRTIQYGKAYVWQYTGKNEDGSPALSREGGIDFYAKKLTRAKARQVLRQAGYTAPPEFVEFDLISEEIRAMTLEDFIAHSVVVNRGDNGYISA